MKKSSRGNPNHYPKGVKGGQFAPKGFNGVKSEMTPQEYNKQTEFRRNNIEKVVKQPLQDNSDTFIVDEIVFQKDPK